MDQESEKKRINGIYIDVDFQRLDQLLDLANVDLQGNFQKQIFEKRKIIEYLEIEKYHKAISVSRDEPGYPTDYAPGYESVLWNTHEVYYPQDVKGNI